jgi:hypothetical protein
LGSSSRTWFSTGINSSGLSADTIGKAFSVASPEDQVVHNGHGYGSAASRCKLVLRRLSASNTACLVAPGAPAPSIGRAREDSILMRARMRVGLFKLNLDK